MAIKMELSDRQKRDRDILTAIWYALRDYGDIQIGQDDRWKALVSLADENGRRFPEARRTFTELLIGMLEDRAREMYQREV